MAVLTDPATYRLDPEEAWHRVKSRGGNPRFFAVLQEVAAWREREAQKRDLPRNRLIRDDSLLYIAAHAPRDLTETGREHVLTPVTTAHLVCPFLYSKKNHIQSKY